MHRLIENVIVRKQFQFQSQYFIFDVLNESINQFVVDINILIIFITIDNISTRNEINFFSNVFDNFKTIIFEQFVFDIYVQKSQFRENIFRIKRDVEIVSNFYIYIFQRFNLIRSNFENFFSSFSHRHRNMNKPFRQKRFYKRHEHVVQHFIDNSNYFELFFRIQVFISKFQLIYFDEFNKLKYLKSKIQKLKQ